MVIGNTSIMREFGTGLIFLILAIYLILFILAWTIGEYFFRKRHKQKHQPLIENITDLLKELANEK
jgi:hypothetical protein